MVKRFDSESILKRYDKVCNRKKEYISKLLFEIEIIEQAKDVFLYDKDDLIWSEKIVSYLNDEIRSRLTRLQKEYGLCITEDDLKYTNI